MKPQNTVRFCSSNNLSASIKRHMSSVQAYNSLTNYITDPLNMITSNTANELAESEEVDALNALGLKSGKCFSLISVLKDSESNCQKSE